MNNKDQKFFKEHFKTTKDGRARDSWAQKRLDKAVKNNDYEFVRKEFKRLAKMADQRLVRLEKLAESDEKFANVTAWAYKVAQKEIENKYNRRNKTYTAPRFNRDIPTTTEGLKYKIKIMEHFMFELKTSTKSDIINTYEKRAKSWTESYNKARGLKGKDKMTFTWEDIAKLYESDQIKKLNEAFDSDTVRMIYGKFKDPSITPDKLREMISKDQRIFDDQVIDKQIKTALKKNRVDYDMLTAWD